MKRQVESAVRVKAWAVFSDAVERGVALGWARAHKHTDKPDRETIQEHIQREVENAVCEYFEFSPEDE